MRKVFFDSSLLSTQAIPPNGIVVSGIEEITRFLKRSSISELHLVSHGSRGSISVGKDLINKDNLAVLESWKPYLTDNADIFVYGCDVAAGLEGIDFLQKIADVTSADVAASADKTGDLGNWGLEIKIGSFESQELVWKGIDLLPTYTYYDRNAGTVDSQGWMRFQTSNRKGFGAPVATQTLTSEGMQYSSLSDKEIYSGWATHNQFGGKVRSDLPELDRWEGFQIDLALKIEEGSGTFERTGTSLVVVTSDRQAISIGFARDRVFAHDQNFFASQNHYRNTTALTDYRLKVQGTSWELQAWGSKIMEGKLTYYGNYLQPTDYPTFVVDPYEVPNLIFFGDETTRATGKATLRRLSVTTETIEPFWRPVGTGDFNRDGKIDLAWHNKASGDLVVWEMDGVKRLRTTYLAKVDPTRYEPDVADLNRDGNPDFVWNDFLAGVLSGWYMNRTSLVSTFTIGRSGPDWEVTGVADFNKDGHVDLLLRYKYGGNQTIWNLNNGYYSFSSSFKTVGNHYQAVAGNFYGDYRTALFWHDSLAGADSQWLLSNNQIQSTASTTFTPSNWVLSASGDFNRDGRSDVVWWDPSRKIAVIHYYNGSFKIGEANLEAW